jgi:hypothetical protein
VRRGSKFYDSEKDWSSINHLKHSGQVPTRFIATSKILLLREAALLIKVSESADWYLKN